MNKYIKQCILKQVTVFLTNGVKLSGVMMRAYDDYLILARDGVHQLVMRQAIATVMPDEAFEIEE